MSDERYFQSIQTTSLREAKSNLKGKKMEVMEVRNKKTRESKELEATRSVICKMGGRREEEEKKKRMRKKERSKL